MVKALDSRGRRVRILEIRKEPGRFTLSKRALDVDELCAGYPRRARSVRESFRDLTEAP